MKESTRLSKALEKYAASSVETHALAFDVSMVRGKPLLALRALRRLSVQKDQRAFVVRLARPCVGWPSGWQAHPRPKHEHDHLSSSSPIYDVEESHDLHFPARIIAPAIASRINPMMFSPGTSKSMTPRNTEMFIG